MMGDNQPADAQNVLPYRDEFKSNPDSKEIKSAFLNSAAALAERILHTTCPPIIRGYLQSFISSPLGERMANGAFWCFVGSLVSRGINFLYLIVAARILGLEDFGALGVIITTVGVGQILAGLGLGVTATKYVAEYRQEDPIRTGQMIKLCELSSCGFGLLAAALLVISAPWLASRVLNNPNLAHPLIISSFMLFFSAIIGTQSGALAGFEAFQSLARINAIASLSGIPLMIVGGYWGGLNGILLGMTAPMVIQLFLNHRILRKTAAEFGVPVRSHGCWKERRILLNFSLPAFLASIIAGSVNWICTAILVNAPHGYKEMGIYCAAFQWYNILIFLPDAIGQVSLPMLSKSHGESNSGEAFKILRNATTANGAIVLPMVLIGWILSPFCMLIFGPSFRGAGLTLAITIATAALVSLEMPLFDLITASGRMWMITLMNLVWAVVLVGLSLRLAHFGATGMVFARLSAYIIHAVILIFISVHLYSETLQRGGPSFANRFKFRGWSQG